MLDIYSVPLYIYELFEEHLGISMIFHMLVIEELRFQEVTIQESQFLNVTQLSDCRTYDLPFTLCRSCLLSHKVQMARID